MCIIFISNHYKYYCLKKVLYYLFVSVSIVLIMTIITLLFALYSYLTNITIMAFQFYQLARQPGPCTSGLGDHGPVTV
jgi:hypothetical protein